MGHNIVLPKNELMPLQRALKSNNFNHDMTYPLKATLAARDNIFAQIDYGR